MYIPSMLKTAKAIEAEGFDAALLGCFGDPGLDGAREIISIPIIGIAEASFHVVSTLADAFAVIMPTANMLHIPRRLAERYHCERRLVGVADIGCPIMDIRSNPDAQYPTLLATAEQLVAQGAEALVLGCGSMSFYAERLQRDTDVPCINPLRVGLRMAELLVSCGLSHSRRTYPAPAS